MAPSEECEPLLTDHKDVDAIEQGLGISPSNNHRPPVWTWRLVPIVAIIVFLCAVLSYGIGGLPRSNEPRTSGEARMPSDAYGPEFPDFSRYCEHVQSLSSSQLHFEEGGRLIVVGDIHGMKKPLDHLLKKLRFQPDKDKLIHTGDTIIRGPHSLEVLEFLTANNVSGVRGNNDQKVVEWRSWFNWVRSFPDGGEWMERDEESIPKDFPFPDDWKWASPHWHIAYHMTNEQYEYLLSLPLVLHIPTLHTMVVHAGLLPLNPKKSLTSKHQPLARIPVPPIGSGSSEEQLRTAQEIAVVKEIPQNRNPWVITNLRSLLKNGRVSKGNNKGRPWPDIWNKILKRCAGFHVDSHAKGSRSLPCRPFTVVYGHAAARGKDIRKWSKGIDSGCVYGRKLSALVYSETPSLADLEYEMDDSIEVEPTTLGHNIGNAQIVSVKCD